MFARFFSRDWLCLSRRVCVVEEFVGEKLLGEGIGDIYPHPEGKRWNGREAIVNESDINNRQTGHNTNDVHGAFEIGIWSLSRPICKRQKRGRHSFELQLLSLNIGTHI